MLVLVIGLVVMTLLFVCAAYCWNDQRQVIAKQNRELAFYEQLIQTKNGYVVGFGNYQIISFDKGKTWYNYETTNEEPVQMPDGSYRGNYGYILNGLADPKLVERLGAFADLTELAKLGPLDLSNPTSVKALEAFGFKVTKI